jgi:hypothetical protein
MMTGPLSCRLIPTRMMVMTGLFFVMMMVSVVKANNGRQQCTLACPDEAPCVIGVSSEIVNRVVDLEAHQNGMHCDCPIGKFVCFL